MKIKSMAQALKVVRAWRDHPARRRTDIDGLADAVEYVLKRLVEEKRREREDEQIAEDAYDEAMDTSGGT
jgi:hypothetical protein